MKINWSLKYRNNERFAEWAKAGGQRVLEILSKNGEMSRSQLTWDLGVKESTLDMYLGAVRGKIYTVQAGKTRWYILR